MHTSTLISLLIAAVIFLTLHPVTATTATESPEWHSLLSRHTAWNTSDPCSHTMPDLTREKWHNLGVDYQYMVLLCYLQFVERGDQTVTTKKCLQILDQIPLAFQWRELSIVQRAPLIDCLYSAVLLRALMPDDASLAMELIEPETRGSLIFTLMGCVGVYSQYVADRRLPLVVLHHAIYRQFWLTSYGFDTSFYAELSTDDDVKRLTFTDYLKRNSLHCPAHTSMIWATVNLFLRHTDHSFDHFIGKMRALEKT